MKFCYDDVLYYSCQSVKHYSNYSHITFTSLSCCQRRKASCFAFSSTLRFTFIVGVIILFSTVQASCMITSFAMRSWLSRLAFTSTSVACRLSAISSFDSSSPSSSTTIAIGCFRLAPTTQICAISGFFDSSSSIGAGATYFPLSVLNNSLMRPVILR